ncbi:MAG: DNA polymerase III subunit delta [Desulforhopalus sp.]
MALLKRTELPAILQANKLTFTAPIFLFFGERFLCRESADLLQKDLLRQNKGAVHTIDGDEENPDQTLARLMSFSLLPGRQIYRINNSRIFLSKTVTSKIWAKAEAAFHGGQIEPARRYLLSIMQVAGIAVDGPTVLSEIPEQEWKRIFDFDKPTGNLSWADNLLAETPPIGRRNQGNLADRYIEAFDRGVPAGNFLLLTAETVDKRQRFFTYIKKKGIIIDCSVTSGATAAAQSEQKNILKEVMLKTLAQFGKDIDPKAVEIFFDRVGFHPVAVVTETEKLAHHAGDRPLITRQDLETMVARNREDALYELTDAFSNRQTARTLTILARLLEQGIHSLAILATMRNYLRKQLIFRSLQMRSSPPWRQGMQAKEFQNHYLPALKAQGDWGELLTGHPYALFMSFTKASTYSSTGLKRWLVMLLQAEFRLKGAPLPQQLVLEELFISMLKGSPRPISPERS